MAIIDYLIEKQIPYWTSGPNVSKDWVGIQCMFCPDSTNHLGISLRTGWFHCLKCKASGSLRDLIMEIEGCPPSDAYRTVRRIMENGGQDGLKDTTPSPAVGYRPPDAPILPSTITPTFENPHKKYLIERGFDPDYLVEKYDLKSCYTVGRYRWRIIIPVYLNKKLVNFTARAIRKGLEPRYYHCPNDRAIVPRRDLFYNIDNATARSVVIVEGPTDVWRIGDGAICSFGTEVTDGQISLLIKKKIQNIFILFDKGETESEQAEELSNRLKFLFDHVEILELIDEGDPGESGIETVKQIREVLNGG